MKGKLIVELEKEEVLWVIGLISDIPLQLVGQRDLKILEGLVLKLSSHMEDSCKLLPQIRKLIAE